MRRAIATALLALSLGATGAVSAVAADPEDADDALVHALSRVPLMPAAFEGLVGWVDLEAVVAAREGAANPDDLTELLALLDADDPAARLWMAAVSGVASGSGNLMTYLFVGGPDWPRTVGFDFTDLDTVLSFGSPPSDGLVLTGSFDPDAIGAALAARDFTGRPADGVTLWCGSVGCDEGLQVDVQNLDRGDPFGGHLGRRQPLAVAESELLSSADIETVVEMLDAAADRTTSLADDPAWAGLAGVLAREGTLLQATFMPAAGLAFNPLAILGEQADPDTVRELLAELAKTFEPIAPTSLIAFGDAATDTEQVVTVALAYPTLADAERAADVLPRRLETMQSLRARAPWREVLTERGAGEIEAEAVELPDGGAAARLVFRAPLADPEPDEHGRYRGSSLLYRLFVDMVMGRDTDWLAPSLPTLE